MHHDFDHQKNQLARQWRHTMVEQPIGPPILQIAIMVYAIALLLLFPYRDVTQPPGRLQVLWEVLFPGCSSAWHFFGGIILIAWSYLVLQLFLTLQVGSPYFLAIISIPNLSSAYGIAATDQWPASLRMINPSWGWIYLAPTVLFAVNLFVVLRARRRA
jgi:hypothetical protein